MCSPRTSRRAPQWDSFPRPACRRPRSCGWPATEPKDDLTSVEVRDNREHAALIILSGGQTQLSKDRADMFLDGRLGDPQRVPDACIRPSLRHQCQHLALSWREDVEWVLRAACSDNLLYERWLHPRCALEDPLERLHELVHVGHATLEQVAAPLAAGQQRG